MKTILIILISLSAFCELKAQPPTKFYTRFGGNGHDIGYGVKQTLDGHYIVTGSTSSFGQGNTDVYLAKVDSMGWVRWEKAYGGFNNDIGRQVIQLADSGYVIAGYTNSQGNGGYDVYLLRTDKNGTLIWQKTFGGMDWDFAYDLKQTADNGYLVCGSTMSSGRGKTDGYIIKTDANGVLQWSKNYGGAEDDEFKSMVLTYNNLYAFAGTTKSYGDVNGDCWLFKTDLNGDSVLHVKYGDNKKQIINDFEEHPITHDFHFCGGTDKVGFDSTSAYILGLSETGAFLFEDFHTYHKLQDEQYVALTYIKNNDYIYSRKNKYFPSGDRKLEPMISEYSNNIYLNATTYGSPDDDELFDLIKTKDKGFLFVGYTQGFNANLSDVFIVKLDSNSIYTAASQVGVNEVSQNSESVNLFPSVTTEYCTVTFPKEMNNCSVTIRNELGQILESFKVRDGNHEINMRNYSVGIYFVSFESILGKKTFKVLRIQ